MKFEKPKIVPGSKVDAEKKIPTSCSSRQRKLARFCRKARVTMPFHIKHSLTLIKNWTPTFILILQKINQTKFWIKFWAENWSEESNISKEQKQLNILEQQENILQDIAINLRYIYREGEEVNSWKESTLFLLEK